MVLYEPCSYVAKDTVLKLGFTTTVARLVYHSDIDLDIYCKYFDFNTNQHIMSYNDYYALVIVRPFFILLLNRLTLKSLKSTQHIIERATNQVASFIN